MIAAAAAVTDVVRVAGERAQPSDKKNRHPAQTAIAELEAAIGAALCMCRLGAGAPPTVGDRFEVEAVLGTGGFGTVVRARDRHMGRPVAIKLVPTDDPAYSHALIAEEARALARLHVEEVVTVYDWLATSVHTNLGAVPCVAIVMALVGGENLRGWMARTQPPAQRLAVLVSASKGLEAVHAAGLVHRDFKPENVMVTPDDRAQVVDFGLAYRVGHTAASAQLMPAGVVGMGTPDYMAPETLRGTVTPRSDQYSFAVTAWEVLTGKRPFATPGRTCGGQPSTLPHADRIEASVANVLARGLADETDRFPTLADLRVALEGCLAPRHLPALHLGAVGFSLGAAVAGITAGALALNNPRRKLR